MKIKFFDTPSPHYQQIEGSCNNCNRTFPFVLGGSFRDFRNDWSEHKKDKNSDFTQCGYCGSTNIRYYGFVDDETKSWTFVSNGRVKREVFYGQIIHKIENVELTIHNEVKKFLNDLKIKDFRDITYLVKLYQRDLDGNCYLIDTINLIIPFEISSEQFKIPEMIQADYDYNNKFYLMKK